MSKDMAIVLVSISEAMKVGNRAETLKQADYLFLTLNEIIDGAPEDVRKYTTDVIDRLRTVFSTPTYGLRAAAEFEMIVKKFTRECLVPFAKAPIGTRNVGIYDRIN